MPLDPLTDRLLTDVPNLGPQRAAEIATRLPQAVAGDPPAWRSVAATARVSAKRHPGPAERLLALAHLIDAAIAEESCRSR